MKLRHENDSQGPPSPEPCHPPRPGSAFRPFPAPYRCDRHPAPRSTRSTGDRRSPRRVDDLRAPGFLLSGTLDSMSDDWPVMVVKWHALLSSASSILANSGALVAGRTTSRRKKHSRRHSERRAPMSKNGSSLPIGVHRLTKRRLERRRAGPPLGNSRAAPMLWNRLRYASRRGAIEVAPGAASSPQPRRVGVLWFYGRASRNSICSVLGTRKRH
jgi:hypothetical protein